MGAEPAASASAAASIPDNAGTPVAAAAGPDVTEMQTEFDEQIAEALLADDVQRAGAGNCAGAIGAYRPRARCSRISTRLASVSSTTSQNLKEGESQTPLGPELLYQAVLPAVRIAIRLIGRPKVVNLLAGLLGQADLQAGRTRSDPRAITRNRRCGAEAGQSRGQRRGGSPARPRRRSRRRSRRR